MDSIKSLIIKYVEAHGPKYGGQIEDYIRDLHGSKASNASRRCRELVNEGFLYASKVRINGEGPWVVKYSIRPPVKLPPAFKIVDKLVDSKQDSMV